MTTSVAAAGEVTVEGEHLGRIEGFRFVPDTTEGQADQKTVMSAALRALRQDLPARLQAFAASGDGEIVFDGQLRICWAVARSRACCQAAISWRPRSKRSRRTCSTGRRARKCASAPPPGSTSAFVLDSPN